MRVIRTTIFPPPGAGSPVTAVVAEPSLTVSIEEFQKQMRGAGTFILFDVFESQRDPYDIPGLTLDANERLTDEAKQRDLHLATHYYWTASRFRILAPGGVVASDRPAPLTADELRVSMEQLAIHPDYDQSMSVLAISKDGKLVTLRGGKITFEDMP